MIAYILITVLSILIIFIIIMMGKLSDRITAIEEELI